MEYLKLEKWYLRSSGYKDYFRISTEETEKEILYINASENNFNETQKQLEKLIDEHNDIIKLVNPLLKASINNCKADNTFKLHEDRTGLRKAVIKISENAK